MIEYGRDGVNGEVERLWAAARNRTVKFRTRPSVGNVAVLLALAEAGPTHGRAIARAAGQHQCNVTAVWLPKLDRFGFVAPIDTVPGLGHQGGGRPAVIWALTRTGRALAEALAAEREREEGAE